MFKPKPPTVTNLFIPKAARFLRLPKSLTKVTVQALFDQILEQSDARRVAQEIRVPRGSGPGRYVYLFLCFRMTSPVPFLAPTELNGSSVWLRAPSGTRRLSGRFQPRRQRSRRRGREEEPAGRAQKPDASFCGYCAVPEALDAPNDHREARAPRRVVRSR